MTSSEVQRFARELDEHLTNHILPFWCGPALDNERGGWMGWLSNDLKPDRTQPRGLIVSSRILWAFSAAWQAHPFSEYRVMADRAYEVLRTCFWDEEQEGAFWQLADDWQVLDNSKKTYGQAFFIYALSEYHRAFGSSDALGLARRVFHRIESHTYDARHGGYVEVCRRDWSEAGPGARLSDKDMSEKKSMNNHLHVLEAYTNLYRVWEDPLLASRLTELIQLFDRQILNSETGHFHHFFDETWTVRSDTYTFGHDIEGSWLLCEAAEVAGDKALIDRTRSLALEMTKVTLLEGVDADGGLCYEGRAGQIIDFGKECWPQAEALVGFINAWQLSDEAMYLQVAHKVWEYVQRHLVDRVHGEWFWRINEDGKPDASLPKVSEWKGPYHATRACLEGAQRLAKQTPANSPKPSR